MDNKCDCGNSISIRDLGEDATQCEWCEHPEPPYYKINHYGDSVELRYLGMIDGGVTLFHSATLTIVAPSPASARAIRDDYLAQMAESE